MAKEQLGRYGENPHQTAWIKTDKSYKGPTVLTELLHGEPGYNNLQDANAALEIILEFSNKPAVAVIKHKNPCGLATGEDLAQAFEHAWFGDPISSFGSIIGYSQHVTKQVVRLLSGKGKFVEVLVAPSYDSDAVDWIKRRKPKTRVIATGSLENPPAFIEEHKIRGGTLSQTQDNGLYLCDSVEDLFLPPKELTEPNSELKYQVGTVTEKNRFTKKMQGLVEFAIIAGKHTKSNAIIITYEYEPGHYRVLGMGAGQPNRKDSGEKLALPKAQENLMRQYFREQGLDYPMTMDRIVRDERYNNKLTKRIKEHAREILSSDSVVLYSDAFFPFRDGLVAAAELGVKYIIQPGGSKGDPDVIKAAEQHDVAMIFIGKRHFRH